MYFIIIFILIVFLPMLVIALARAENKSSYEIILKSIIVTLIAATFVFGIAYYTGHPMGKMFMDIASKAAGILASDNNLALTLGIEDADHETRKQMFLLIYQTINMLTPAVYAILVSITSYLSYIILYKSKGRFPFQMPPLPALRYFTWPNNMMLGFFAIGVLAMILKGNADIAPLAVYENLILIFRAAFSVQGLALYLFYMHVKKVANPLKGILLILILMTSIGRMLLFIFGLIDYVFGLRARILLKS